MIIFILQFQTTDAQSLTLLSNDEQRIHDSRVQYYAPSNHYVRLIFYKLNLVNVLEGDIGTALTRMHKNFFEILDPNIYFFGGFPRQRVEASDFEKFPYLLVIPFLIGIYITANKKFKNLYIYLGLTVLLITFIGHNNNLGPFVLFPYFVITIYLGSGTVFNYFSEWTKLHKYLIYLLIVVLLMMTAVLSFYYAK